MRHETRNYPKGAHHFQLAPCLTVVFFNCFKFVRESRVLCDKSHLVRLRESRTALDIFYGRLEIFTRFLRCGLCISLFLLKQSILVYVRKKFELADWPQE